MLYLMNKDNVVAEIGEKNGITDKVYSVIRTFERLPYGCENINTWLEGRKASKHNDRLRQLMRDCGCGTTEGYIRITHAATLNDTFWIRNEAESITWNDVSMYRNRFNETVSKLAFEGLGLYGIQMSGTSPELTTGGSFRKCWIREEKAIYLYKRGSDGAANAGLEPYCEVLASEIAKRICGRSVEYELVNFHGSPASKCRLFTSEEEGYIPLAALKKDLSGLDQLLTFYESIGSEDDFRRMCVLDALILNTDRHTNNHGVLIDNDTQEIIKAAPIFDFNMALLPRERSFENIGRFIGRYSPCIGDDFTHVAKSLLTPAIRADLINLKGYRFEHDGWDVFPKERVRILEGIVNRHIDGLLDNRAVYLSDIFPDRAKTGMKTLSEKIGKMDGVQ